ncbi:FtsW/RodA/SpoVE family cell cycle protein [Neobacillus sp. OS1-32]|uniref:FtsW/RodA/SpoVE family cell cycle protein n=1 Tax=Neobacillus sp. OS1-32 TaxID=3070682 RepID=UPI0027E076E6|nr:FtsW/RodA/SpoVE family cell cycle protein [Neobacillus sp. OS1-32]WML29276.1 FtsW/RodA/SpoVE family cell cycle protein [Neobacillus sp. OS1-32]
MNEHMKKNDRFDWTLTLLLFLFFLISCIAIYSAQSTGQYVGRNFMVNQIFWYGVGAVIIAVTIFFDSFQYKKLAWILYGFGLLLLIGVYIAPESIAPIRNGAKSWFLIGRLGQIQPSEFVKVFLILALSRVITSHHEKNPIKTLKTDFILLLKLGITTAAPVGLIMLQPDLGTALVILSILTGIILVSGISWKIIVPIYGAAAALGTGIIYLVVKMPELLEKYLHVPTYQFNRIYSWLDPYTYASGSSYHLVKSLSAIGSGLISGKGFRNGEVYVPEAHTDFIFSVIGEEYGFIGGSIVISLYFLLIYHLIKTALDTNDPFNSYVCTGIISMIAFHVFQNIGMTIQVLPITGIPLPFISYGGSSLMGNMFAMGLVYSIHFHHRNYMFSSDKSLNI